MATSNTVEINVNASVTGQPEITKLTGSMDAMAPAAQKTGQAGTSAGKGLADMGTGAAKADDNLSATRRGLISISKQLSETQKGISSLRDSLISGWSFQQFVQAAAQMEQVQAGLTAVAGNSALAGQQMDFVRSVATRTGVDVTEAARAFLGLSAATKGTAVEGEPTRAVFEAVASAMAKAGKSSAETQNALTALSQIASKGVVSMEELRGQLGEALPGALQAVASGLGVTTQDLNALVESGQVAAQDLFPALVSGLKGIYGTAPAAQTLSQEITNIKNSFVEMAANIGEAGGLDALKAGAELAQTAIVYLDDTLVTIGKTIGVVMAAIVNMDFSGLKQAFADIELESRTKLLKAAEHNTVLAASLRAAGTEAVQAALANQDAAKATTAVGAAAATAAPQYIALANAYTKVRQELAGQIEQAEKSVAARDKEAAAMVALAKLYGTDADVRQASAKAAAVQAEAAQKLADVRATEVAVMSAELAAKTAQLKIDGQISDQRKKELKDLADLIDKRQADADKARAQAAAAKALADQATLEIEKHKDNSARLTELKDAYEAARLKLAALQKQKAAGKATDEQVEQADKAAARAAALYRDALSDVIDKLKLKNELDKAGSAVSAAGLNVERERLIASKQLAEVDGLAAINKKSLGQAVAAGNALQAASVGLIKNEIAAATQKQAGQVTELKNTIAGNAAKIEAAKASGALTQNMQAEADASTRVAQAKIKEIDGIKRSGEQQAIAADLYGASAAATKAVDLASKGLTDTLSAGTQAKLDNAKAGVEEAQAAYDNAKASGDELGAAEALVKVKEAELEYARVLAEAKHEEAAAARESANAKAAEARAAAETAAAIAAEIAAAETVTAAMKAQAAEARVNAIAKAGAAKEAYAHADALDAEAKGADKAVAAAERAVGIAKKSLDDVRKATDDAANSARGAAAAAQGVAAGGQQIAQAFDPMAAINQKVATLAKELGTAGNTAYELQDATALASQGVARLGEQNLQTLRAAIDSATQKMQTMSDAAKTALTSVQDELDQLNANYDDIERRKYESKLKELQTLLDQAMLEKNQGAAADLREAIAKTKQLYEGFKIPDAIAKNKTEGNLDNTSRNINQAEQAAAQDRATRQRNIDAAKTKADDSTGQTTDPAKTASTATSTSHTVTLNIGGTATQVNVASELDAQALITALKRAQQTAG